MRKVEQRMVDAVARLQNSSEGNTQVRIDSNGLSVSLHGNIIYQQRGNNIFFTLAGWNTPTTRSRLNALGVRVSQKNWQPIYNGEVIDAWKWYQI